MSSDARFLFIHTDNHPSKIYPIPDNKRVRLRSRGVLGPKNDAILQKIAARVGDRNLRVLRMTEYLAVLCATVGDAMEEAIVSPRFLVPNDLSEEQERNDHQEVCGITRGYVVTPPPPALPADQQMIAPPKPSS